MRTFEWWRKKKRRVRKKYELFGGYYYYSPKESKALNRMIERDRREWDKKHESD